MSEFRHRLMMLGGGGPTPPPPPPPPPIPTGYTQVQYLHLDGSGYIDLDEASVEATDSVEIDFQLDSVTAQMRIISSNSNNNRFNIYVNGSSEWAYRRGSNWRTTGIAADTNRHTYLVDHYHGSWKLDSTAGTMTGQGTSATVVSYIGGEYSSYSRMSGKIYGLKYWRNGALIKNYIMLRDDSYNPYVYDLVAQDFVSIYGSGTTVGADV